MIRLLGLLFVLCASAVQAQDFLSWRFSDRYFTVSAGTGFTRFYGDVTGKIIYKPTILNVAYEARLLSAIGARVEAAKYSLKGRDSWADFGSYEQQRNLAFNSKNWEANFQIIYYFKSYRGDFFRRWQWDPYVAAGAGITTYDPTRRVDGVEYFLREIETEANKEKYGNTSLVIPISAGIKFKLNDFVNLNLELTNRIATTDYLDDVSGLYPDHDDNEVSLHVLDLANPKDLIPTSNVNAYEQLTAGTRRGNSSKFDSYAMLLIKLEFYLPPILSDGFKKTSAR